MTLSKFKSTQPTQASDIEVGSENPNSEFLRKVTNANRDSKRITVKRRFNKMSSVIIEEQAGAGDSNNI